MKLSDCKVLTDENIDFAVANFLRGQGFDVFDVKEGGLVGADDLALIRLSVTQQRIVVTHDRDFGTLAISTNEPYFGILYLRPAHISSQFTIGTLRTVFAQQLDVSPPFLIVAARNGDQIHIRLRQS